MYYTEQQNSKPMTVGDWFVTLLVLAVPVVNVIMYLVWACGSSGNLNRKNFCVASILCFVIVLAFVVVISLFASVSGMIINTIGSVF